MLVLEIGNCEFVCYLVLEIWNFTKVALGAMPRTPGGNDKGQGHSLAGEEAEVHNGRYLFPWKGET